MKRQVRKWTTEEDYQIGKCANAAEAVSLGLNRTESAVRQRYFFIKKKAKTLNSQPVEKKEKKVAKRGQNDYC